MSRITRITGPDGSTTTIKQDSGIGCCAGTLWVIVLIAVVIAPAELLGAWSIAVYAGIPLLLIAALVFLGLRARGNTKGVPLDEPEKDAAYWAAYVARVSGNPQPPPV